MAAKEGEREQARLQRGREKQAQQQRKYEKDERNQDRARRREDQQLTKEEHEQAKQARDEEKLDAQEALDGLASGNESDQSGMEFEAVVGNLRETIDDYLASEKKRSFDGIPANVKLITPADDENVHHAKYQTAMALTGGKVPSKDKNMKAKVE